MNFWQPYLIAILVGMLVGIERERSHAGPKTMGFRTFLLISLLGAVAGEVDSTWLSILLAVFVFGLILVSYFTHTNSQATDVDRGLTTEFAAGMVFALGYTAHSHPVLSALLGPAVALLLFSKKKLHNLIRAIRSSELEAALILLLMAVAILNVVPDKVIDPWGIFNPQKFGYLVLTLGVLEFSSYVIVKVIGVGKGSMAVGFLGGLVSSTAVTMSSAKQVSKTPDSWGHFVLSTVAAQAAALVVLLFIVFFVSPRLATELSPAIGSAILACGVAIAILYKKASSLAMQHEIKSPLDVRGVLRLALLLAAILASVSVSQKWIGASAVYTLSFVTGLFELHGMSLANSTLFAQEQLSAQVTKISICIAVLASLISKIVLAWMVAKGRYARVLTLILAAVAAVVVLVMVSWI